MAPATQTASIDQYPVQNLRPHPLNSSIYGDSTDETLVASIRENGVLSPLLVTVDGVVISGHRRLEAAKAAGLSYVPVYTFANGGDDLAVITAVVEANRQRVKTNEQFAKEAAALLEVESALAQRRIQAGAQHGGMVSTGQVAAGEVPAHESQTGEAIEVVASKLGVGKSKVRQATTTQAAIESLEAAGQKEAADALREKLNKSVSAGYNAAKAADVLPKKPAPAPKPVDPDAPVKAPRQISLKDGQHWRDVKGVKQMAAAGSSVEDIAKWLAERGLFVTPTQVRKDWIAEKWAPQYQRAQESIPVPLAGPWKQFADYVQAANTAIARVTRGVAPAEGGLSMDVACKMPAKERKAFLDALYTMGQRVSGLVRILEAANDSEANDAKEAEKAETAPATRPAPKPTAPARKSKAKAKAAPVEEDEEQEEDNDEEQGQGDPDEE